MQENSQTSWSISDLLAVTSKLLDTCFPTEIWLCGVLSGYKDNAGRHRYFRLVEYGSDKKKVIASVDAVAFYNDRVQMGKTLKGTQNIEFRDQVPVRLLVKPTMYKAAGRFQVIVKDIDPYYTTGVLIQRREEVLQAMRELNVATKNLSLPFPRLPLRLALLTSETGEAKHDFMHELTRLNARFRVTLFDIRVQGHDVERTVVEALEVISQTPSRYDLVVIVRGGGSVQDLSYFDTEAVAHAVCLCPVKVVVGIGHERDQTVLDSLAYSVKTPTAAAGLIVTLINTQIQYLVTRSQQLSRLLSRAVDRQQQQLLRSVTRVQQAIIRRFDRDIFRLSRQTDRLESAAIAQVALSEARLWDMVDRLNRAIKQRLSDAYRRVERAELIVNLTKKHMEAAPAGAAGTVIRDLKTGDEITSIHDAKPGQRLALYFMDGYLVATVEDVVPLATDGAETDDAETDDAETDDAATRLSTNSIDSTDPLK